MAGVRQSQASPARAAVAYLVNRLREEVWMHALFCARCVVLRALYACMRALRGVVSVSACLVSFDRPTVGGLRTHVVRGGESLLKEYCA